MGVYEIVRASYEAEPHREGKDRRVGSPSGRRHTDNRHSFGHLGANLGSVERYIVLLRDAWEQARYVAACPLVRGISDNGDANVHAGFGR